MECEYIYFRVAGMAGEASDFGCLDLDELAPEETFQVEVQEEAAMVSEDDLVERVDSALLYEWENSGRDKNVIQALSATAVGAGFSIGAMRVCMRAAHASESMDLGPHT